MKQLKKKQKEFLEEYSSCWGNITIACKNFGITRRTYYNWLEEESFKNAIEELDITERKKDRIEDALMSKVEKGDTTAIIFACKTLLKDRGYIETRHYVNQGISLRENFKESIEDKMKIVSTRFKDLSDHG